MNYIAEKITNPALGEGYSSQTGEGFLQSFLPAAIGIVYVIGAIIFVFLLITGAISWMTSGGDKQAVESARGKITSAIIGLVLLLISFAIIGLIENFFGIQILRLDIMGLKIG